MTINNNNIRNINLGSGQKQVKAELDIKQGILRIGNEEYEILYNNEKSLGSIEMIGAVLEHFSKSLNQENIDGMKITQNSIEFSQEGNDKKIGNTTVKLPQEIQKQFILLTGKIKENSKESKLNTTFQEFLKPIKSKDDQQDQFIIKKRSSAKIQEPLPESSIKYAQKLLDGHKTSNEKFSRGIFAQLHCPHKIEGVPESKEGKLQEHIDFIKNLTENDLQLVKYSKEIEKISKLPEMGNVKLFKTQVLKSLDENQPVYLPIDGAKKEGGGKQSLFIKLFKDPDDKSVVKFYIINRGEGSENHPDVSGMTGKTKRDVRSCCFQIKYDKLVDGYVYASTSNFLNRVFDAISKGNEPIASIYALCAIASDKQSVPNEKPEDFGASAQVLGEGQQASLHGVLLDIFEDKSVKDEFLFLLKQKSLVEGFKSEKKNLEKDPELCLLFREAVQQHLIRIQKRQSNRSSSIDFDLSQAICFGILEKLEDIELRHTNKVVIPSTKENFQIEKKEPLKKIVSVKNDDLENEVQSIITPKEPIVWKAQPNATSSIKHLKEICDKIVERSKDNRDPIGLFNEISDVIMQIPVSDSPMWNSIKNDEAKEGLASLDLIMKNVVKGLGKVEEIWKNAPDSSSKEKRFPLDKERLQLISLLAFDLGVVMAGKTKELESIKKFAVDIELRKIERNPKHYHSTYSDAINKTLNRIKERNGYKDSKDGIFSQHVYMNGDTRFIKGLISQSDRSKIEKAANAYDDKDGAFFIIAVHQLTGYDPVKEKKEDIPPVVKTNIEPIPGLQSLMNLSYFAREIKRGGLFESTHYRNIHGLNQTSGFSGGTLVDEGVAAELIGETSVYQDEDFSSYAYLMEARNATGAEQELSPGWREHEVESNVFLKWDQFPINKIQDVDKHLLQELILMQINPETAPNQVLSWMQEHREALMHPKIRSLVSKLLFGFNTFAKAVVQDPLLTQQYIDLFIKNIVGTYINSKDIDTYLWALDTAEALMNHQKLNDKDYQKRPLDKNYSELLNRPLNLDLQTKIAAHYLARFIDKSFDKENALDFARAYFIYNYLPVKTPSLIDFNAKQAILNHQNKLWEFIKQEEGKFGSEIVKLFPNVQTDEKSEWKFDQKEGLKYGPYRLSLTGKVLKNNKEMVPLVDYLKGEQLFVEYFDRGGDVTFHYQEGYFINVKGDCRLVVHKQKEKSPLEAIERKIKINDKESWFRYQNKKQIISLAQLFPLIPLHLLEEPYRMFIEVGVNSPHIVITKEDKPVYILDTKGEKGVFSISDKVDSETEIVSENVIDMSTHFACLGSFSGLEKWKEYFNRLEDPRHITFHFNDKNELVSISLDRLGLDFILKDGQLQCKQFTDFYLDLKSQESPFKTSGNCLILKNKKGQTKTILPFHPFMSLDPSQQKNWAMKMSIPLDISKINTVTPYFVYESTFNGDLKANTPAGALYLSLLYRTEKQYEKALRMLKSSDSPLGLQEVDYLIEDLLNSLPDLSPEGVAFHLHFLARNIEQERKIVHHRHALLTEVQKEQRQQQIEMLVERYKMALSIEVEEIYEIPKELRLSEKEKNILESFGYSIKVDDIRTLGEQEKILAKDYSFLTKEAQIDSKGNVSVFLLKTVLPFMEVELQKDLLSSTENFEKDHQKEAYSLQKTIDQIIFFYKEATRHVTGHKEEYWKKAYEKHTLEMEKGLTHLERYGDFFINYMKLQKEIEQLTQALHESVKNQDNPKINGIKHQIQMKSQTMKENALERRSMESLIKKIPNIKVSNEDFLDDEKFKSILMNYRESMEYVKKKSRLLYAEDQLKTFPKDGALSLKPLKSMNILSYSSAVVPGFEHESPEVFLHSYLYQNFYKIYSDLRGNNKEKAQIHLIELSKLSDADLPSRLIQLLLYSSTLENSQLPKGNNTEAVIERLLELALEHVKTSDREEELPLPLFLLPKFQLPYDKNEYNFIIVDGKRDFVKEKIEVKLLDDFLTSVIPTLRNNKNKLEEIISKNEIAPEILKKFGGDSGNLENFLKEIDKELELRYKVEIFDTTVQKKWKLDDQIKKCNEDIQLLKKVGIDTLALDNKKRALENEFKSVQSEIDDTPKNIKNVYQNKSKNYYITMGYLSLKKKIVQGEKELRDYQGTNWTEKLKPLSQMQNVPSYTVGKLPEEPISNIYVKPSFVHAFLWDNFTEIYQKLNSNQREAVIQDLIQLASRSGLNGKKTPESTLIQLLLFSTTLKLKNGSKESLIKQFIEEAVNSRKRGIILCTFSIPDSRVEKQKKLQEIENQLKETKPEGVVKKLQDPNLEDKYKLLRDYQARFKADDEVQQKIDEQLYEKYNIKTIEEFDLVDKNDPHRGEIDQLVQKKNEINLDEAKQRLLRILSPEEKKNLFGVETQNHVYLKSKPPTYLFNRLEAIKEYKVAFKNLQLEKQAAKLRQDLKVKAPFEPKALVKSEKIELSSFGDKLETFTTEEGSISSLANIFGDFFIQQTKASDKNNLKEWEGLDEKGFFSDEEMKLGDPIAKEKMESLNQAAKQLIIKDQTTYTINGEPNFSYNSVRREESLKLAQEFRDEALSLVNTIEGKDLQLAKKSKQKQPHLTLQDLMGAYLKQDMSHLLEVNPTLTKEKVKEIFNLLMKADLHTCRAKQYEEIDEILDNDELSAQEQEEKIGSIVHRSIDMKALEKYPQLSLYAAATGLWPREDQIKAIDWALEELQQGRNPAARLLQMGAGAGKTKVFTVLVSMIASTRGYGVTVFNVSSLYDFGKSDLPVALRDAFMTNVELVEWDVGRDEIDEEKLVDLHQKLLQWKTEGKVILIKPETWHLINIARKKGKLVENEKLTKAAEKVLKYFQENLTIPDEAHLIFNPLTEVNQSVGDPKQFAPHLTKLLIENYDHLVKIKGLGIEKDQQALAKSEDIEKAKEILIDEFAKSCKIEDKEELIKWLKTPKPEAIKPKWLNQLIEDNKDLAESIELQRRFVHSMLNFVLSKRGDNDYGEYPSTEKGFDGKLYAHPRHDRALTTASYADEVITAALTIQMMHQKPLSKEAIRQLITQLLQNHRSEREDHPIGMTASEKWLRDILQGQEFPDLDYVSIDFFDRYEDLLKDHKDIKEWYLTNVVIPQIEIYERKIVSTPAELMYGSDFSILLTATPGDLSVYPKFLSGPKNVENLSQGSIIDVESEAIVVGLMLAERNNQIKEVDDYDNIEEFFNKVVDKNELKDIKFIIDKAGGFRKLKDGHGVLKVLHKLLGENTSYGVVVKQTSKGRKAHFITYGKGGEKIPLEGSNLENEMKKGGKDVEKLKFAVFFYSILEAGAGTDWKLPDKCTGIFTVGENMKLSDAIQALKRDRKLALHTHSFKWVIQKALKEKIAKSLKIAPDQLTPHHLVRWMINNEAVQESKKVQMRFEQGVDQILSKKIVEHGTKAQEKSLEVFTDKSPLAWSNKKEKEDVSLKILLWQSVVKKIALTHPEEVSRLIKGGKMSSINQEELLEKYIKEINVEEFKMLLDPKEKMIKKDANEEEARFKILTIKILGEDIANRIEELVNETDKKTNKENLDTQDSDFEQEQIKVKQIEAEVETETEVEMEKIGVDKDNLRPNLIMYKNEDKLGVHAVKSKKIDEMLLWPQGVGGPEIYGSENFFQIYKNNKDLIRPVAGVLVEVDLKSKEKKYHLLSQEGLLFYSQEVEKQQQAGRNYFIVSPTGGLLVAKTEDKSFEEIYKEPLFRQMICKVALFQGRVRQSKYTKQLFQNWVDNSSVSDIGKFIDKIGKTMSAGLFVAPGAKFEKNKLKSLLLEMFKEKKLTQKESEILSEPTTEENALEKPPSKFWSEAAENTSRSLIMKGLRELTANNDKFKKLDLNEVFKKDIENMVPKIKEECMASAERTLASLKSLAVQHRGTSTVSLWDINSYLKEIDEEMKINPNQTEALESKKKRMINMQKFYMRNVAKAMMDLKNVLDTQKNENSFDLVIKFAMEKLGPGIQKDVLEKLLKGRIEIEGKKEKIGSPYRKLIKEAEEQFFDQLASRISMDEESKKILGEKFKEILAQKLES